MKNLEYIPKGKIDHYSIMIASKYFSSINDFINLELCSPKFKGNVERFHFNPISLNEKTIKYFKSLETLHLYSKEDVLFLDNKKIIRRILWEEIEYEEYIKIENKEEIEFKKVRMNVNDIYNLNEIPQPINILYNLNRVGDREYSRTITKITLPQQIKKLEKYCLTYYEYCEEIQMGNEIEEIGEGCFAGNY